MSLTLCKLLVRNAYIHIDKIHVVGPCRHTPIGKVIWNHDEEAGFVPAGSRPKMKQIKDGSDEAFIHSKDIQNDGFAYQLEIRCCPPKALQRHNVFGHSDVVDYAYAAFDHATRQLGIEVDPQTREEWRHGGISLTEIHLTGNFGCPARDVRPIIDAIDANNVEGKHRDGESCITLGFTGKRRSKNHTVTVYYKFDQLKKEWKKPGEYQRQLMDEVRNAIRGEVKLHSDGLKVRKLQYVANWRNVDVAALFFEIFGSYEITHAIQPLLTEGELAMLTKAELRAYRLWLAGDDFKDLFGRTTAWRHAKSILEKTGMDCTGDRRPEKLPEIHLGEIFRPENVLPIPQWIVATEFLFPRNQPDLPRKRRSSGIGDASIHQEAD